MRKIVTTLLLAFSLFAMAETTVEIGSVNRKAYPMMNEVDVTLTTKANEDVRYLFNINSKGAVLTSGKTYTDITGGMQDLESGDYVNFTQADYTETLGKDDSEEIVAHVTLENGESHSLHYQKAGTKAAVDTVNVVLENCSYMDASTSLGDPVVVISGAAGKYDISLSFYGETLKKSYTKKDVYDYYTHLSVGGQNIEVRDVNAQCVSSEVSFNVSAYILGADAHCYYVQMQYQLPIAKDTIAFAADNMLIDESKLNQLAQVVFSASNDDYVVELWLYADKVCDHFGHRDFDLDNCFIEHRADATYLTLLSGDVTVTLNDNVTRLSGGVLASDSIYYALDMTYTRPKEPTRELTLEFEGIMDPSRVAEEGVLSLKGNDMEMKYELNLLAYVSELAGTITEKQMDTYETCMKALNARHEATDIYDLISATLTLSLEDDWLTITGTLFMQSENDPTDAPLIHVTVGAVCETGRALDCSDADFSAVLTNYVVDTTLFAKSGVVLLDAANADTTKMLALTFYTTGVHPRLGVPMGTYNITTDGMPGTVAVAPDSGDGQVYPSFAANSYENGEPKVPLWYLMEGTVTVSERDGQLSIVVDAMNSFKRTIKVTVGNVAMDTVLIDMNDCELASYEEEKKFQFLGQSTKWEAYVAIAQPFAEGTYGWEDAVQDYCRVRLSGGAYAEATDLKATVTKAANGYDCEAYMVCQNAVCYHILFHYYNAEAPAKPLAVRNINAHNLKVDSVWIEDGFLIYDASTDSLDIMLTVKADSHNFDAADFNYEFTYMVNRTTGAILRAYTVTAYLPEYSPILPGDESEQQMMLLVHFLGHDGILYEMTLDNTKAQGLWDAQADRTRACKRMVGGQLLIIQGEYMYNAQGIRVK